MQLWAVWWLIPLVPIPLNYAVMFVAHHRWLGPVWPADLAFRLVLAQRLGVASGIVAQLAGHAALDDLPWLTVPELLNIISGFAACFWKMAVCTGTGCS